MLMKSQIKANNALIFSPPKSIGNKKNYWGCLKIVGRWMERSNQRRELAELDDRLCDDIGITRFAIAKEIAKPFWR